MAEPLTEVGWCRPGLCSMGRSHRGWYSTVPGEVSRSFFSEAAIGDIAQGTMSMLKWKLFMIFKRIGVELK